MAEDNCFVYLLISLAIMRISIEDWGDYKIVGKYWNVYILLDLEFFSSLLKHFKYIYIIFEVNRLIHYSKQPYWKGLCFLKNQFLK